MPRSLPFIALAILALASCREVLAPDSDPPTPAALAAVSAVAEGTKSYIVVFKSDVSDPRGLATDLVRQHGGTLRFTYRAGLKGFAAALPSQALDGIRRNPLVEFVESDDVVSVTGIQSSPPSWGLDRIDARDLPLNAAYSYPNAGAGVRIYLIDTGLFIEHQEFAGRAGSGWDFVDNDAVANDCHGHGTHVGGTIAGATVGVAKQATIIAVRALNCIGNGTESQIIAALDWVIANHVKPAVINMSLSGAWSAAINAATEKAVSAGITVAVAAGNETTDACTRSPASASGALTVGAETSADGLASFSNYGSCLDVIAPGAGIYSSVKTGGYETWSGTSMASPHVAGAAALFLAANPAATPAQVASAILGGATSGKLSDLKGSPDRLLYTMIAGAGVLEPLPPPLPPSNTSLVAIGDLDGSAVSVKGGWTANVTILVVDGTGRPVSGAYVSGSWANGTTGTGYCTTGEDGRCAVSRAGLKKGTTGVTFAIFAIAAPGMAYAPDRNSDPDKDSNGTSIAVVRP